jgi:hypothetical protein
VSDLYPSKLPPLSTEPVQALSAHTGYQPAAVRPQPVEPLPRYRIRHLFENHTHKYRIEKRWWVFWFAVITFPNFDMALSYVQQLGRGTRSTPRIAAEFDDEGNQIR